jgi:hypothetical protein
MALAQDLMQLWTLELAVLGFEVLLPHRLLVTFWGVGGNLGITSY